MEKGKKIAGMIFWQNTFAGNKASSAAPCSYCSGSGCRTFCTGSPSNFFFFFAIPVKDTGDHWIVLNSAKPNLVSNLDEHFKTWEQLNCCPAETDIKL